MGWYQERYNKWTSHLRSRRRDAFRLSWTLVDVSLVCLRIGCVSLAISYILTVLLLPSEGVWGVVTGVIFTTITYEAASRNHEWFVKAASEVTKTASTSADCYLGPITDISISIVTGGISLCLLWSIMAKVIDDYSIIRFSFNDIVMPTLATYAVGFFFLSWAVTLALGLLILSALFAQVPYYILRSELRAFFTDNPMRCDLCHSGDLNIRLGGTDGYLECKSCGKSADWFDGPVDFSDEIEETSSDSE